MDKQTRKAPVIRFKGFNNDWEQRKLGEIANKYDNLRVPVAATKRQHGAIPYYGANGIQDFVSGYTHDGEYILVAEDGANNPNNYPVNYVNGKVWVNNHAHVLQGKNGIASNLFLLNAIKKINIVTYLVGGSRNKLNAKTMAQLPIQLPSINEQEKIGQLFQKLNHTITLHEEKQHQLEQLKKALLQKMFADKSGYPELRFKGFTDTWEQVQVSKLFTIKKNNTFSRSDLNFEGGSTKNIHYGDILVKYGEILDANSNNIPFITKDISSNFDNSYLQNGDIVMADTAEDETVGKSTEILNLPTNIKLLAGLHTIPLSPRRKFASGYLGFYLNSNSYHDTLRPLMQGIKVTSISKNELKKTVVCFPRKYIEQQKIGELFIKLNSTITLHAKKIEQLKRLKQALLQKMFV